mmetsp:Transcript_7076/g.20860  ORF Transcript_7076/g.20860 Transcript_7076/m.20860 type:complete len:86 (-) Transcript_7076:1736-1993(-)
MPACQQSHESILAELETPVLFSKFGLSFASQKDTTHPSHATQPQTLALSARATQRTNSWIGSGTSISSSHHPSIDPSIKSQNRLP